MKNNKRMLDHVVEYMSDGKPHKLIDVVSGIKNKGVVYGPSAQYIFVYQTFRDYPSMFRKTGRGVYEMVSNKEPKNDLDFEEIKDVIVGILNKNKWQSPSEINRRLLKLEIVITSKTIHCLLQSGLFRKNNKSKYSNA